MFNTSRFRVSVYMCPALNLLKRRACARRLAAKVVVVSLQQGRTYPELFPGR